ncbi:hypothetical protein Pogu_0962 [Pyrobaculum oguniense TE7]|uniref:Uncharacterized protein n=1 Tax=Pyrobaculum oguniense (strain DSM 13380 / JCM 10595 / TE7) TaxID=698757 RepID=H6Q9T1_PYROT|nr:hypothetical protein Pogu_0962 [Pyrobaculum oguniense TE7]
MSGEEKVEPILPVEKKLVAISLILAAILMGVLYVVAWATLGV